MATVSLVTKEDGFTQYTDKVLAKKSANSKELEEGKSGLQLRRTRRDIYAVANTCNVLKARSNYNKYKGDEALAESKYYLKKGWWWWVAAAYYYALAYVYYFAQSCADKSYNKLACDYIYSQIKKAKEAQAAAEREEERKAKVLKEVAKFVSKILTEVEQTRIEMHQGIFKVLSLIKNSRIDLVLTRLNNFIRYFDIEKDQIRSLRRENYIIQIDETNNFLNYLGDLRIPKGDNLYTLVNEIINRKFSIPTDPDDKIAISALYALHYGTQTYVSILFFLIEQHSYIADYYYEDGDLKKFNEHFGKILDIFQEFRKTLVEGKALIENVINIINEVQAIDFIADDRALTISLSEKLQELEKVKHQILEMKLPVIMERPEKLTGQITFKSSSITTPFGAWQDGTRVYYAIQYKNGSKYSKVGAWSDPLIVDGEAYPTLKLPVDPKRNTRLIFRKFNNNKPQLIGTIEDKYQTEYRDLDRDLYNAASWPNKKYAESVVDILLKNGANSSAIFDYGRCALHSAAESGNSVIAIEMLKPADINIRDDNGYTPLHIAAEDGHDDLIKALVKNGADINVQTFDEEVAPIHLAARMGYLSTVRSLMECQGINMNLGDNEGFTPLHSAVTGGLPVTEAILSHKDVDINKKSNTGLTALHLAAMNGYVDVAKAILKHDNLSINIEGNEKRTALHFATILGHFDMVQFLQNNDADLNVKDVKTWTPLHYAIFLSKEDIALQLLNSTKIDFNPKNEDSLTPMHIACGSGQDTIVQMILKNKPCRIGREILNTETKDGLTPLHIATMKKYKSIVTILIENDADIEAQTNLGQTPLMAAAENGDWDIITYLARNNADMNAVDMNGTNAINLAAENGHLDVVMYFVEDRNFSLEKGNTIIESAIPNGHLEVIKYLVDIKGVKPECVNSSCPLSVASKYGIMDIVSYLVPKDKKYELYKVLHTAVEYGHLGLVKYVIEEKDQKPNSNTNGKTPMLLAVMYGWVSIVKYLQEKHNITFDYDKGYKGDTYRQLAITSGNLYLVKYLLTNNLDPKGLEDTENKKSPLHFAVYGVGSKSLNDKQSSSVLMYLVDKKHYDINAQNKNGSTPLHDAVLHESFYPIKFLISRGADLYKKSTSNETPLDLAIKYNKSVEIQELLQMQPICNMILEKKVPIINQSYNVNVKCVHLLKRLWDDIYHTTALHLAVFTDAIDTVKLLLTRGANVNATDEEGNIPLHLAVQNGNEELIKILTQSGDGNLINLNSQTPKDLAKENHAMNIVKILNQAQLARNRQHSTKVKRSINQEASLGIESSPKPQDNVLTHIIEKGCGNSSATPLCLSSSSGNQDSIDVRGAQCLDSNISLGLLLGQNFLNKKFPLPNFTHVTPVEARAIALSISKKFEKLLKKHAKNAGDFDFYQLYVDIEANIKNKKFSNVPNVLLQFAKNVCGKDVDTVSGKIAYMFP